MKIDKYMPLVIFGVVLAIGAANLWYKYAQWNLCREHHGIIFCWFVG